MIFSKGPGRTNMVDAMDFKVLGAVGAINGTESLALGGPKQRTVLAMLVAHVGDPLTVEVIAEAVYGDNAPLRSRRTIQTYVSALRSIVGDVIEKEGSGWVLRVDTSTIDAVRFELQVESAKALAPDSAAEALREALAMWRGHPYGDVEAHNYLDAEISRLTELRLGAMQARIDADLELGRHAELIAEIDALMAQYPYREGFRAQHMLALYRSGRQREALASYQQMRTLLIEDIGADPMPSIQQLEQQILVQHDALTLAPARLIQRRAVLVSDLGDPLELARVPPEEREKRLERTAAVLRSLVATDGDHDLILAGTTNYLVFDSADRATTAAMTASTELEEANVRFAIDWGDIEVDETGVSGPPVSRGAALVSVAHPGQVLISAEAHHEAIATSRSSGLRFESLGVHELSGVEAPTTVLQVLVGHPPRTFPSLDIRGRVPAPLPGRYRSVPGYELREQLGHGSTGMLYRAYQASIGREVIIEVIGRAVASQPEFIRHFEADAQRLALLDHPHINPLLDYWRDPDGACLVYRNRRGGFLASGAEASPHLIEQIGGAIAYSHSYGIVHGSIGPDRILLDESGFGYLMGFPVGNVSPQSSSDHAAYIAPESLSGGGTTVATDVYALGVLGHEIASGVGDADRPMTPTNAALARALSQDPNDRQSSVEELIAALATSGADTHRRFTEVRNPYKGLAAFRETDFGDFFGREELTDTLVSSLSSSNFLAVVGPSGIGKSSVVRAGLIPALRNSSIKGSESWVITDMLPGTHPFRELRRALERVVVDLPSTVTEKLMQREPDALADLRLGVPFGAELVLVIDQFEELFALADESVTSAFLDLVLATVEAGLARVVVTMRADFLDRPLLYASFGQLLGDNLITVSSPNRAELTEAIVGPAGSVGLAVDADLVERICADIQDRSGALPLLQHTLVELFNARTSDRLTLEVYEEIDGVAGSLRRRAEAIFAGLDEQLQRRVQSVFLQLVTVVDDGAPMRRRARVADLDPSGISVIAAFARARLLIYDIEPETRTPTVEVAHEALLTEWNRLGGWIEAHRGDLALHRRLAESVADWEASDHLPSQLLTEGRLAQHEDWVETTELAVTTAEQDLLTLSRLAEDDRSSARKRRRQVVMGAFAGAALLAGLLALLAISASRRAEDRELAAEQAELAAEEQSVIAQQERDRAESNATLAEANSAEATENAQRASELATEAKQQRGIAEGRALGAAIPNTIDQDPQLALLLAISAADLLGDTPASATGLHETVAAQRTLYETEWTGAPGPRGRLGNGSEIEGDLSADGKLLAVVGPIGNTVEVHDVDGGALLWVHTFEVDRPLEYKVMAQFIGNGDELLLGLSWHPKSDRAREPLAPELGFHVMDSVTGEELRRYDGGPCGPVGDRSSDWAVIGENASSTTIAVGISQRWFNEFGCSSAQRPEGSIDGYPEVDINRVDLVTGESVPIVESWDGGLISVAMSGDGRRAALGDSGSPPGTFTVIDIETGDVVNVVDTGTGFPGLLLNHDGSIAVSQGPNIADAQWFEVESGALLRVTRRDSGAQPAGAWFSANGSEVLVSDWGGGLFISDSTTDDVVDNVPSNGPIGLVRATPDLRRVATFGSNFGRAVTVSTLAGLPEAASFNPCRDASRERKFFLNRGLLEHEELLTVMAFCDPLVTAQVDLPIVTSDRDSWTPALAYTYSQITGELLASHQVFGQTLAVADDSTAAIQTWSKSGLDSWAGGEVAVIDLRTGARLETLSGVCNLDLKRYRLAEDPLVCDGPGVAIENSDMAISADGNIVAIASFRRPTLGRVWNRATGTAFDLEAPVGAIGISPDGSRLVVVEQFEPSLGSFGAVKVYTTDDFGLAADATAGAERVRGGVDFSPNGKTFAVIAGDPGSAIRIHDIETAAVSRRLPQQAATTDLAFSSTGELLAAAGADGYARIWETESWTLVDEIEFGGLVTAVAFVDNDRQLAVSTRDGGARLFFLEFDDLLEEARRRVGRGFNETECGVYFPDGDCPTLDDLLAQ